MSKISINVALAFDQNYINQFFALTTSIFLNNKSNNLVLHAITSGVSDSVKNQIKNYFFRNNSEVLFYEVPKGFGENFVLNGNWTAATYYRLLLPELIPSSIDRIIYLDTDTVVIGDLSILYNLDINYHVLAAVRDKLIVTRPELELFEPYCYFNAGVLLINKKIWIEQQITEQALKFLNDYPEKIKYADQDALNYVLRGNWYKLDLRFNLMFADLPEDLPKTEHKKFLADKIIIHFTQHRPWKMLCINPFRYLYHNYSQSSPFPAKKKYLDFSIRKVPDYIKIRLVELYLNLPVVKKTWRKIKLLT